MFFRLRVLTHGKTQIRLASLFVLWFVVFVIIFATIFFINFADLSSRTEGLRIHDQLATKMLLVEQSRDLALWYGGGALVFAILMWIYMMVYSHRLTGPIYKLERVLEKAIHNRQLPDKPLNFRQTDAFHEMARLFNEFVEKVCRKND